jgi:hypothetical protein
LSSFPVLKRFGRCARAHLPSGIGLAAAMLVSAGASPAPLHRYTVQVGESLDLFTVKACFEGKAPAALVAETSGARAFLEYVRLPGRTLQAQGGEIIAMDAVPDNACIDYRVKLRPATSAAQTGGAETRRIGGDLLTSVGDWLWRPQALEEGADIELSFVLPPGVAVSAPWVRAPNATAKPTFRLGPTPYTWPAIAAFGRFAEKEIAVPGALLRVAFPGGMSIAQQARAEHWIAGAARNVTTLYGRFPVQSVQVIVVPTPRGRGPVPWAYVSRGGGAGVHLFVDPTRAPEEFERDWSLTHEMSHLFLPFVAVRDAWLFEGLPTYLQNVLMVRGGAIEAHEGWSRLITGFQRGAGVGTGLSVAQASERIAVRGNYLRVYWAGAAMMLEADLRLREITLGRQSLDTALAGLAECCLAPERRWSADELVATLDRITGNTVFGDVVREQFGSPQFPDFKRVLVRAGVTVKDGGVVLDRAAPAAPFREALMRPAASPR